MDDKDKLYFCTRNTRKTAGSGFVKTSTVSARFIQERMGDARCQQILILDCCYSGAIADGLPMKGEPDVKVDVKTQLSGEGRAVLTSSTGTQYSFAGKEEGELSVYTQYIVEGIETGAGDEDGDGQISAVELHNYAKRKVLEATDNAMQPKIYPMGEGFNIIIAEALEKDPQQIYREEVQRFYQKGKSSLRGTLRFRDRKVLNALRHSLDLSAEQATLIEREVLQAHRERQRKLRLFRQIVEPILTGKDPITHETRHMLIRMQRILDLRLEEIDPALANLLSPNLSQPASLRKQIHCPPRSRQPWLLRSLIGVGAVLSIGAIGQPLRLHQSFPALTSAPLHTAYYDLSDIPTQLSAELFPDLSTALPPETIWQLLNQQSAIHLTEQAARQVQSVKSDDQVRENVVAWKKAAKRWAVVVQLVRQHYIATTDAPGKVLKDTLAQQRRVNFEWQQAQQYLIALETANQASLRQLNKTEDWRNTAQQWRKAHCQMSSIRGAYTKRAQLKAKEYQRNATVANKQAQRIRYYSGKDKG